MSLPKQGEFTFKHSAQTDKPSMTSAQLKASFDSRGDELKTAINVLVDALEKITSTSGAENIGSAPITGVAGATLYAQMIDLKAQINQAALGQIPNGSLSEVKLSFAVATQAELDTHLDDYVRQPGYGTTGGSANTYTLTLSPTLSSYADGVAVSIKINVTNTGASTLNVNGLGVISLLKANGDPLDAGDLLANSVYSFRYNGTNFILQSESGVKISGQTEETILFGETISRLDPIYVTLKQQDKLTNPTTLPTNNSYSVAFSSDDLYMAVAHASSSNLTIYKRSGDIFTKLADPTTLPPSTTNGVAFSSDTTYLAVACSAAPFLIIYKRGGDVFTKLPDPAVLPTDAGRAVAFSSDGLYVAVVNGVSPYVTIYKRSGDIFTKLANPAVLPTAVTYAVAFSTNADYMVVGLNVSPFIIIYKRNGDTFTQINPATSPPNTVRGVAFSSNNLYMAVAVFSTPFIIIYKRNGDTFTKLADPAILPTGIGYGVAFSSGVNYLAVSHDISPFLTVYKREDDTFTKIPNPAILPTSTGNGVGFSNSDMYMTVAESGTPYITIYKNILQAFLSNAGNWRHSNKLGYAKEAGVLNDVKKVIITQR